MVTRGEPRYRASLLANERIGKDTKNIMNSQYKVNDDVNPKPFYSCTDPF